MTGTLRALSGKEVPRHRQTFWYCLGGVTLFFFCIQAVSGILLSFYYQPTPEHAYESVRLIVNEAPHGWLVRSIHAWSAHLMIGTLFVHMFSTFLMKAYRKPRELMWVSGVGLLLVAFGFAFTGNLLPWDNRAYFATLIGTEVPKTLPLVGVWGVSLIRGAGDIGGETLTRMHTLHVTILPLTALLLVSFHLMVNQVSGISVPIGVRIVRKPFPFFPDYTYRECLIWIAGFGLLLTLATVLPWGLGNKADPMASAPIGIRPEWYFLPLYQTLRFVPASILSINGELIVNLAVGLLLLLWAAVPFLDRQAARERPSPVFTAFGCILILYLAGTIAIAYLT